MVGLLELDALRAPYHGVTNEDVVLRAAGVHDIWEVASLVRVKTVPVTANDTRYTKPRRVENVVRNKNVQSVNSVAMPHYTSRGWAQRYPHENRSVPGQTTATFHISCIYVGVYLDVNKLISPAGVFENVVLDFVVRAPNGQTDAVLVVREVVVGHQSPAALEHGHTCVTVVENIVVCEHSTRIG